MIENKKLTGLLKDLESGSEGDSKSDGLAKLLYSISNIEKAELIIEILRQCIKDFEAAKAEFKVGDVVSFESELDNHPGHQVGVITRMSQILNAEVKASLPESHSWRVMYSYLKPPTKDDLTRLAITKMDNNPKD